MLFTGDGGIYRNTTPNNPDCQNPNWVQPNITPHATWLWGFDGLRLGPGQHAITYGLQDDGGWAATNVAEGFSPPTPNWNNYVCCDINDNEQAAGITSSRWRGFFRREISWQFQLFLRDEFGNNGNTIGNYPSTAQVNGFKNGKDIVAFAQAASSSTWRTVFISPTTSMSARLLGLP